MYSQFHIDFYVSLFVQKPGLQASINQSITQIYAMLFQLHISIKVRLESRFPQIVCGIYQNCIHYIECIFFVIAYDFLKIFIVSAIKIKILLNVKYFLCAYN